MAMLVIESGVLLVLGVLFVAKPMPCGRVLGTIAWHLSVFAALGQEKYKKQFFPEKPLVLRILGVVLMCVAVLVFLDGY